MRIAIGCDHGAFALKNKVIEHLEKQGHEVRDFGTYSTESCDYPDFAAAAARAVASGCPSGFKPYCSASSCALAFMASS